MAAAGLNLDKLGRYQLIEQIGRGGMASVFKALDPVSGKEVAIKVLSPVLAQEQQFTKRFEREAEVVMRLSHPNIVPVVDFGQDAGYAYLVMPLLNVGSLADRLIEGPLTPGEGGRLLTQLTQALQFAHDRGVVHRDVKPSNVLMDENGSALLADFGLARIHDASVSLTGSALLGTPAYMSPEQARGEKVGPASDQYSLGVVLYQLCTGNLPFEAETPMAVMLKHINEPVPLAREKSPNVPEAIEHVILKATAKAPEQRFGSVTELNAAFQAALAHARDPFANPAPHIELPPSSVVQPSAVVGPVPIVPNVPQERNRLRRLAGVVALLLVLALACPVAYLSFNGMLQDATNPAEGSGLSPGEMSEPQLTALAGTIAALSTELAAAGGGTQSPEQIQTAVMATMSADGGPFGEPSGTPGLIVIGDGTASTTPNPGSSPTPSLSPTPGPSPTPSKTPTITQTPSPGPSPTPSNTPTASKTPTPTATATPGPSPTPTNTATATLAPTSSATSVPSKTPTQFPTTPAAIIPTDPPPVDPCEQVNILGWIFSPPVVGISLHNGNLTRIELQWIRMDWPPPNDKLIKFDLGSQVIWDEGSAFPPTWATSLSGDRKIGPDQTKPLMAVFETANPGPYGIEVGFIVDGFGATCTVLGDTG